MNAYTLASIILTLAVLIGYVNHRFIRLQGTIAIMSGSLLLAAILLIIQHSGMANIASPVEELIRKTDFRDLLLKGMLSFLLFAGSLSVDFNLLKSHKWEIGILASLSTIASTLLVGWATYYLLPFLGLHLPLLYCFLFGALISPTDPIAVLATFKEIGAPKNLEICVAGESLFNDGVAIVIFLTLYQLAFQGASITFPNISMLFLRQAIGGIGYGVVLGYATHFLMRGTRDHKMAILLTLVTVTGGYSFAEYLNISGPLAMVVAGIIVGNQVRKHPDTEMHESMEMFWEIIDEVLNAVLFLLIGFELLTIKATGLQLVAAVSAIPIILFIRLITVAIPMKFITLHRTRQPYMISILTWGGLRGGLAVALALSLPPSNYRDFILAITFAVVAFAVIVQGITIKPLARAAKRID